LIVRESISFKRGGPKETLKVGTKEVTKSEQGFKEYFLREMSPKGITITHQGWYSGNKLFTIWMPTSNFEDLFDGDRNKLQNFLEEWVSENTIFRVYLLQEILSDQKAFDVFLKDKLKNI
jgi:hypothetical protein